MALFKKKMSKEDIIAAIKALSDEEQMELFEEMASELEEQEGAPNETAEPKAQEQDDVEAKGESETEEQIDKAEEDIAEKGADSQTEKDRIDESVGEQEAEDGNKDSQDAKDRVDESEAESERVEAEDKEEVNSALGARITALEEQFNSLADRLEQMLSNLENKDFGAHHGGGAEKPATEDDEAYMDAYYKKQPRRN